MPSRSRLVRLARHAIGRGVLRPEDRHRPASALSRALAEHDPSCTLTNSTIQDGSLDHNSERQQSPRPPRRSPARGPTPSSPRQGPTRGGDPPGGLSFQAAAHPGDLTRRRSDGCRPFPAPIHPAWPTGRPSRSERVWDDGCRGYVQARGAGGTSLMSSYGHFRLTPSGYRTQPKARLSPPTIPGSLTQMRSSGSQAAMKTHSPLLSSGTMTWLPSVTTGPRLPAVSVRYQPRPQSLPRPALRPGCTFVRPYGCGHERAYALPHQIEPSTKQSAWLPSLSGRLARRTCR